MKHTWVLRRFERDIGHVGIDGTHVHVQHPDDPTQILDMPHPTAEAARTTANVVLKKFFNSRHGWKVALEQPDYIDLETWLPKEPEPPTPEEIARARQREYGWVKDGTRMVIWLKSQARVSDLEMTLEHAADVTELHVVISCDDRDGVGRDALMDRLVDGVAPHARIMTFESATAPRNELAEKTLPRIGELLEAREFDVFAAVGLAAWPEKIRVAHLRVHDARMRKSDFKRIGNAHGLRVLELAMPSSLDTVAELRPGRLADLALEQVDVPAMLERLLDGGIDRMPRSLYLQGLARDGSAMRTAIARWQREAPDVALSFGKYPMSQLDPETRAFAIDAGVTERASPFAVPEWS